MVRPRVDDDGLSTLVERYAEENGLRTSRAWADLVRSGLIREDPDFLDLDDVEDGDQA